MDLLRTVAVTTAEAWREERDEYRQRVALQLATVRAELDAEERETVAIYERLLYH